MHGRDYFPSRKPVWLPVAPAQNLKLPALILPIRPILAPFVEANKAELTKASAASPPSRSNAHAVSTTPLLRRILVQNVHATYLPYVENADPF